MLTKGLNGDLSDLTLNVATASKEDGRPAPTIGLPLGLILF